MGVGLTHLESKCREGFDTYSIGSFCAGVTRSGSANEGSRSLPHIRPVVDFSEDRTLSSFAVRPDVLRPTDMPATDEVDDDIDDMREDKTQPASPLGERTKLCPTWTLVVLCVRES